MWVHLFLVTYRIYSFSFLAFSSPNKTHSCRYFLWNTQNTTKSKTWAGSEVCRHVAWHHAWRSFKVFFWCLFQKALIFICLLWVCAKNATGLLGFVTVPTYDILRLQMAHETIFLLFCIWSFYLGGLEVFHAQISTPPLSWFVLGNGIFQLLYTSRCFLHT